MSAVPVRVAVFGDAMIDYAVTIDSHASRDEKHAVTSSRRSLGGSGGNAATAVTRILGPSSTDLFATVSDDAWGQWIVEQLRSLGVGTDHIALRTGSVPHAVIVHDGPQRHLLVDRGVADNVVIPPADALAPYRAIYVSNPHVVLSRLQTTFDTTLVVGVEHQMCTALSDADFARADVLITNEAGWNTLRHRSIRVATVVTAGDQGATLYRPGQSPAAIAAIKVEVRDASGAGDAFAGALTSFLATGLDLPSSMERANAIAAQAVTTPGAQLGPIEPAPAHRDERP
jgi:ribokinase